MKLRDLQHLLHQNPDKFPRFVLPDGNIVPGHAHVTEIAHVVRHFIDCGGVTGKEEKAVLQTHVGHDSDHRLSSLRLSKILELGQHILPSADLEVEIEYDCCVVAQYPISATRPEGDYLNITLERGHTQCRPRERREHNQAAVCCTSDLACCG